MELLESHTHSFVIKIWLEETAEEAGQARWRGLITHIPSGARRYLRNLDEILSFIAPYLIEMGVEGEPRWQMRQWFNQLKQLLKVND